MNRSCLLKAYGWLFLASGAAFVVLSGLVARIVDLGVGVIPGAVSIPNAPHTLWLGLTGSMMAMIAYLCFVLAEDLEQALAWNTLLLSKGMSTSLCIIYALVDRNPLFLVGSVVDGSIFLHLLWLRGSGERDLLSPRLPRSRGPFYEVWFAKLNDPASRSALWVRYTVLRSADVQEAACWYIYFDKASGQVVSGRQAYPLGELRLGAEGLPFQIGDSTLEPGRLRGRIDGAAWDLAWKADAVPGAGLVPRVLTSLCLAATDYTIPVLLGSFSGEATIKGKKQSFNGAPGSLGHLWGHRMGDNWRWAHAALGTSAFEILTAQAAVGPVLSPRLTTAQLWHEGRLYSSSCIWRAWRNGSAREGDRWSFKIDFGELQAEGDCSPDPKFTAALDYLSPDGRKLICRNSKTGALKLTLRRKGQVVAELSTADGAAVEFVGPA